jgi:CBS domain-containing protein
MLHDIKLSQIMTTNVKTVHPDDTMEAVQNIFEHNTFHHVPVVKDGNAVGIISRSDYDKLCHSFTLFNHKSSERYNDGLMKSLLVIEVMSTQLATLNEDDTILTAAAFFRENLFHAIPIVNSEKVFVGIVTTYDLLNYAFKEVVV